MKKTTSKNIYVVNPARDGHDDSAIAVFDAKGNVFEVFDVYHGDLVPESSYRKLGMNVVELNFSDLVKEHEVEDSCCTNQLPSHDLVVKRAKLRILSLEKA